jgi:hypothetical protein
MKVLAATTDTKLRTSMGPEKSWDSGKRFFFGPNIEKEAYLF